MSITEDGQFELRLRSEYKYDWNTDNVKLQFTDAYGVSLVNALYAHDNPHRIGIIVSSCFSFIVDLWLIRLIWKQLQDLSTN